MKKTITVLFLCFCLLFGLCGCLQSEVQPMENDDPVPSSEKSEPAVFYNPLTGESGLADQEAVNRRPVALMINNIKSAQAVQAGLADADLIYETEVEGGITRLMAVYQDITSLKQIGTIRSARYPYVDLAMGHDAFYIHCGEDPTYCAPHLNDTDDLSIDTGKFGKRIKNGLSSEHTLYTFGDTLWDGITSTFKRTEKKTVSPWQDFAETEVSLTGGSCTQVTVPFSNSYATTLAYDAASGRYQRMNGSAPMKDYATGKTVSVKNVFVLMTKISNYPDGKHRKVALVGGNGWYIVNGTYTPITWSKGNAGSPLVFTNTDGSALSVNVGSSWICLADAGTSQPSIQ